MIEIIFAAIQHALARKGLLLANAGPPADTLSCGMEAAR
jgi:hypothetical protein